MSINLIYVYISYLSVRIIYPIKGQNVEHGFVHNNPRTIWDTSSSHRRSLTSHPSSLTPLVTFCLRYIFLEFVKSYPPYTRESSFFSDTQIGHRKHGSNTTSRSRICLNSGCQVGLGLIRYSCVH